MVDFNQAIQLIRDNGGFKPNANDSSYYRVYTTQGNKPIQVRVSNHGTHLWTWYGKEYNPSISINICVVFSQNGECNSNTNVDMRILDNQGTVVGEKKQFELVQYTYNCSLLDKQDIGYINQAILNIWKNNGFSDPFNGTDKAATKQVLHPVANNKQETNENKLMNKKQTIRLNESQVNNLVTKIVKESVKRVLKENYETENKTDFGFRLDDMQIAKMNQLFIRARQNPYRYYEVIIEGFLVRLYWDENKQQLLGEMLSKYYSPIQIGGEKYGSKLNHDIESGINRVVWESFKGGGYSENHTVNQY